MAKKRKGKVKRASRATTSRKAARKKLTRAKPKKTERKVKRPSRRKAAAKGRKPARRRKATRPQPRVSTPAAAAPVERAKSFVDQERSGQDELVSDVSFDEDEVVDNELTGDVGKDVPEGEEMDDDVDDDLLGKPEELTGEEDDFRS
ncbi:hypothetical protein MYX04_05990 [Nitrospiraceae bacterium AH_259_D15_M11_P09]|nr:hypothetical protein [Nitrospiraceae bacterium AH_259_D15_M11_P09]